jgi:hypothetical protein
MVIGLAACGSDPTPKEACNEFSVAYCAKVYECFTPQELSAAGYPPTESGCVTTLESQSGCAAKTAENACDGNETYHADSVDTCADQIGGLECSQVRDSTFDYNRGVPACDRVCSI